MGLETVTYISDFVVTNPVGATDQVSELDDHVRNLKKGIKNTFPNVTGPVTGVQGDLNLLTGAAAAGVTTTKVQYLAAAAGALYYAGGTDVPVTDGGTGASTAANARTNLGLDSMATQAASAVAITGGSATLGSVTVNTAATLPAATSIGSAVANDIAILAGAAAGGVTAARLQALGDFTTASGTVQGQLNTKLPASGGTDLAVADGGTGASTSADARTNLGILFQDSFDFGERLKSTTGYTDYLPNDSDANPTGEKLVYIESSWTTLTFVSRSKGNAAGPTDCNVRLVVNGANTSNNAVSSVTYEVSTETTYDVSALSGWVTIKAQYQANAAFQVGVNCVSFRIS